MKVLVIGGYGVFGSNVSRRLARDPALEVLIAGRSTDRAGALVQEIGRPNAVAAVIDLDRAPEARLAELGPDLVINASGPFQGCDYSLAEACIAQGRHFVDLADGRDFVAGFAEALDARARAAGVLAVTGASSVPGLSGAVVDALKDRFSRLETIRVGIAPGNRAPRGLAVIAAILGYTGRPLPVLRDGRAEIVHGWQDLHRRALPGLGTRWFSACDVPDVALFPDRYPGLREVAFHAGLELGIMHLGLWGLSWLARWGLVKDLSPLAPLVRTMAGWAEAFGTDRGGMYVDLGGFGPGGDPLRLSWTLLAGSGDGPWIPSIPAVLVARRLAAGRIAETGARPCFGLFTPEEFLAEVSDLDITATLMESQAPRSG